MSDSFFRAWAKSRYSSSSATTTTPAASFNHPSSSGGGTFTTETTSTPIAMPNRSGLDAGLAAEAGEAHGTPRTKINKFLTRLCQNDSFWDASS